MRKVLGVHESHLIAPALLQTIAARLIGLPSTFPDEAQHIVIGQRIGFGLGSYCGAGSFRAGRAFQWSRREGRALVWLRRSPVPNPPGRYVVSWSARHNSVMFLF